MGRPEGCTNDQTHYQFIFIQQLTSNKATLENKLFQTQGQGRLFLREDRVDLATQYYIFPLDNRDAVLPGNYKMDRAWLEMFIRHKEQLSQLDSARLDLNHVLEERNQVLDLLSESVKPGTKVTRGQRIEPQ